MDMRCWQARRRRTLLREIFCPKHMHVTALPLSSPASSMTRGAPCHQWRMVVQPRATESNANWALSCSSGHGELLVAL